MGALWQDIAVGARSWRRTPGLAVVIVLTLAFGIGANATVFSVINTLFLNPLPVAQPDELVTIRTVDAGAQSNTALGIAHPNLVDLRERQQVFVTIAGYSQPTILTLLDGDTPQRLFGELVTGSYFDTLGLRPAAGRFFRADEDATPGAAPVLVMAHAAWQRRFGGATDIVGRTLRISGVGFTVVGVAPDGFKGVDGVFGPDVWMPAMMAESVLPLQMRDWLKSRSALAFRGVARLQPGISPATAQAQLVTIAAALEGEHPDANRGRSFAVAPLTRAGLLAPGSGMSATTISLVLLAIPGLMLLIVCSNVAHLLLARAADRRHEIAVRLALGSGRQRLLRQLLTESALLAVVAGVVGFGFAYAGTQLLWSLRPPEVAANLIDLDIDATVLLFTMVVSLATGVLFGLMPAWQSTRVDLVDTLKDDGRAGMKRRSVTLGRMLTAAQVALSLTALVTAGLLVRSLQQAYQVDPGFETRRLGIALVSPGQAGYSRVQSQAFYDALRTRLAATPGVVSASWATLLPLFADPSRSLVIEGREERDNGAIMTIENLVDVDYFATTGIALTRGRDFTTADREDSLAVAIVNDTLAARAWPGQDPIGRRLRLGGDAVMREVVGVAKTAQYGSIGEAPQPCVYLPLRQRFSDAAVFYVRTDGDPATMLATVQREVRALDSHIEIGDVRTIQTVISQSLFGATVGVGLLTLFGTIALGLASLGLYGAMAHGVRQRQREIGVRLALGAPHAAVRRLMLRQGLRVVGAGLGIGVLLALAVGQTLSGVLFGVSPVDLVSLLGASAVLAAVATIACYLPARHASRVDPVTALRER